MLLFVLGIAIGDVVPTFLGCDEMDENADQKQTPGLKRGDSEETIGVNVLAGSPAENGRVEVEIVLRCEVLRDFAEVRHKQVPGNGEQMTHGGKGEPECLEVR